MRARTPGLSSTLLRAPKVNSHFCIAQPPENPYCEMLWIRSENKTFCYNAIGVFIAAYVNKPVKVGPWDTSITGWKLICVLHEGCLINFIEILFRNWIANDTSICELIYVIHGICAPCRTHLVYLFKHGLLVATEGLMSWRLIWGRHGFISLKQFIIKSGRKRWTWSTPRKGRMKNIM